MVSVKVSNATVFMLWIHYNINEYYTLSHRSQHMCITVHVLCVAV